MHLFQWINLLYLSFHFIGFLLFILVLAGLPNTSTETPYRKGLIKTAEKIMQFGWLIPVYLMATILCFVFNQDIAGKAFSFFSLGIGVALIIIIQLLSRK